MNIRLGIRNVLVIGLVAVVFIVVLKTVLTKYPVRGLSEFVQAV